MVNFVSIACVGGWATRRRRRCGRGQRRGGTRQCATAPPAAPPASSACTPPTLTLGPTRDSHLFGLVTVEGERCSNRSLFKRLEVNKGDESAPESSPSVKHSAVLRRRLLPNPAPCTLHPAPCTLHPAPCTLNPNERYRPLEETLPGRINNRAGRGGSRVESSRWREGRQQDAREDFVVKRGCRPEADRQRPSVRELCVVCASGFRV